MYEARFGTEIERYFSTELNRPAGIACGDAANNETDFAAIASLPQNTVSHTDAGLPRKTTYRYRVMATGSSGNSPYSNIVTVRTP